MKRMKWMLSVVAAVTLANVVAAPALAKLELPRVFGDNVVLQRDKPLNVWGWGDKGDSITVAFNGQTKKTTFATLTDRLCRELRRAWGVLEVDRLTGKGQIIW